MTIKKNNLIWMILIVVFQLVGTPEICPASEITIIANRNVRETSLSKDELRSIYLGEKSVWANEKRINFAVLRKGITHKTFLKKYIYKTPKNFIQYWKRQIMTGKAVIPKLAFTENEIIEYVALTEGAIGYISGTITDNDIKIMHITE